MRLYSCAVFLNGSLYNQVPKINVTAPEIYVLRQIHGRGAADGENEAVVGVDDGVVTDIKFTGKEVQRTDGEERARLQALYGLALSKIEGVGTINGIFGVGVPLPKVVADAENAVELDEPPQRVKRKPSRPKKTEQPDGIADLAG